MADERSTIHTHTANPDQLRYDESYYIPLMTHITGNVLDIGAGALMFVKRYIDKPEVLSVTAVDKFQEDYSHDKLRLIEWVCPDKLPDDKYDTIVSTEFIEHIERDQLEPLLKQIQKRLMPGGKFIGSTPNKVAPTTNPYHLYEYTIDELKQILEQYFNKVYIEDTGLFCTIWVVSEPR